MNTTDPMNRSASRLAAAAFVGSLCCVAAAAPALADGAANDPHGTASSHLTVADLDLLDPAQVAVARERIHQVARQLCGRVEDNLSLSHQPDFVACIAEAMARAEPRLQQLAAQSVRETHVAELKR